MPHGNTCMNGMVSNDVETGLDEVTDQANWSAVTTDAFCKKFLNYQSTMGGMTMKKDDQTMEDDDETMEGILERMREVNEMEVEQALESGRDHGMKWAGNKATPKQLKRLNKAMEDDSAEYFIASDLDDFSTRLAEVLDPQLKGPLDTNRFWKDLLGDSKAIEDEDFAQGFIEGALDLWDKAEGRL